MTDTTPVQDSGVISTTPDPDTTTIPDYQP